MDRAEGSFLRRKNGGGETRRAKKKGGAGDVESGSPSRGPEDGEESLAETALPSAPPKEASRRAASHPQTSSSSARRSQRLRELSPPDYSRDELLLLLTQQKPQRQAPPQQRKAKRVRASSAVGEEEEVQAPPSKKALTVRRPKKASNSSGAKDVLSTTGSRGVGVSALASLHPKTRVRDRDLASADASFDEEAAAPCCAPSFERTSLRALTTGISDSLAVASARRFPAGRDVRREVFEGPPRLAALRDAFAESPSRARLRRSPFRPSLAEEENKLLGASAPHQQHPLHLPLLRQRSLAAHTSDAAPGSGVSLASRSLSLRRQEPSSAFVSSRRVGGVSLSLSGERETLPLRRPDCAFPGEAAESLELPSLGGLRGGVSTTRLNFYEGRGAVGALGRSRVADERLNSLFRDSNALAAAMANSSSGGEGRRVLREADLLACSSASGLSNAPTSALAASSLLPSSLLGGGGLAHPMASSLPSSRLAKRVQPAATPRTAEASSSLSRRECREEELCSNLLPRLRLTAPPATPDSACVLRVSLPPEAKNSQLENPAPPSAGEWRDSKSKAEAEASQDSFEAVVRSLAASSGGALETVSRVGEESRAAASLLPSEERLAEARGAGGTSSSVSSSLSAAELFRLAFPLPSQQAARNRVVEIAACAAADTLRQAVRGERPVFRLPWKNAFSSGRRGEAETAGVASEVGSPEPRSATGVLPGEFDGISRRATAAAVEADSASLFASLKKKVEALRSSSALWPNLPAGEASGARGLESVLLKTREAARLFAVERLKGSFTKEVKVGEEASRALVLLLEGKPLPGDDPVDARGPAKALVGSFGRVLESVLAEMLKSFALRLEEAERDGFLSASQRRVASSFVYLTAEHALVSFNRKLGRLAAALGGAVEGVRSARLEEKERREALRVANANLQAVKARRLREWQTCWETLHAQTAERLREVACAERLLRDMEALSVNCAVDEASGKRASLPALLSACARIRERHVQGLAGEDADVELAARRDGSLAATREFFKASARRSVRLLHWQMEVNAVKGMEILEALRHKRNQVMKLALWLHRRVLPEGGEREILSRLHKAKALPLRGGEVGVSGEATRGEGLETVEGCGSAEEEEGRRRSSNSSRRSSFSAESFSSLITNSYEPPADLTNVRFSVSSLLGERRPSGEALLFVEEEKTPASHSRAAAPAAAPRSRRANAGFAGDELPTRVTGNFGRGAECHALSCASSESERHQRESPSEALQAPPLDGDEQRPPNFGLLPTSPQPTAKTPAPAAGAAAAAAVSSLKRSLSSLSLRRREAEARGDSGAAAFHTRQRRETDGAAAALDSCDVLAEVAHRPFQSFYIPSTSEQARSAAFGRSKSSFKANFSLRSLEGSRHLR